MVKYRVILEAAAYILVIPSIFFLGSLQQSTIKLGKVPTIGIGTSPRFQLETHHISIGGKYICGDGQVHFLAEGLNRPWAVSCENYSWGNKIDTEHRPSLFGSDDMEEAITLKGTLTIPVDAKPGPVKGHIVGSIKGPVMVKHPYFSINYFQVNLPLEIVLITRQSFESKRNRNFILGIAFAILAVICYTIAYRLNRST